MDISGIQSRCSLIFGLNGYINSSVIMSRQEAQYVVRARNSEWREDPTRAPR